MNGMGTMQRIALGRFKWVKFQPNVKKSFKVDSLPKKKKGFLIRKIGQKVHQMAHVQFDEGAILDKSFLTQLFWLGFFGWFFY